MADCKLSGAAAQWENADCKQEIERCCKILQVTAQANRRGCYLRNS